MVKISSDKCLVMNGFSRNSLAILRSLGKQNIRCDITSPDSGKANSFKERHKSKFVDKVYFFSTEKDQLEQLLEILRNTRYEFLFAGGTEGANFISKNKPKLQKYTTVIAEDYEKVERVHDKHKVLEVIEKLNIPHPKSFVAKNPEELEAVAMELNGKAIVKLPDSYASQGLFVAKGSPEEFIESYKQKYGFSYEEGQFPLIQELLVGDLYDTTAFSVDGEFKGVLSQKRLVTAWLKGGGGVVNKTTYNQVIIEHTKNILRELKWNGHIEMDWFYNTEDNQFYFIEINPKYWGTTQLTISAGFDYPYWSILMSKGIEIPISDYKKGLRYRWLEDELLAIFDYSSNFFDFINQSMNFFFRFFLPRTEYSFYWSDIKPFKGNLIETIWLILKKKWGKV